MAKKKTTKMQGRALTQFFDVHFFMEGGTSMWLRVDGCTRVELEKKFVALLDAPGNWLRLNAHSGLVHLRRSKVIGFLIDDPCCDEEDAEESEEGSTESELSFSTIRMLLDDRDINLDET